MWFQMETWEPKLSQKLKSYLKSSYFRSLWKPSLRCLFLKKWSLTRSRSAKGLFSQTKDLSSIHNFKVQQEQKTELKYNIPYFHGSSYQKCCKKCS